MSVQGDSKILARPTDAVASTATASAAAATTTTFSSPYRQTRPRVRYILFFLFFSQIFFYARSSQFFRHFFCAPGVLEIFIRVVQALASHQNKIMGLVQELEVCILAQTRAQLCSVNVREIV